MEEKPLYEYTEADWDSLKTEYKKYWEEHKEEIKREILPLFEKK